MDEERLQAYVNLINEILNCPDGEEVERLKAQPELLDTGLLAAMGQYVEYLRRQGDETRANFLSNFARQLAEALGISSPAASSEEEGKARLKFLMEILQATAESNGNPEVVYPLLQAKQDQLDDTFSEMLRRWAEATLAEVGEEQAQGIAVVLSEFSNLIQKFPLGNKASNLEIAITGYQIVGTVFTCEIFPQEWAAIQNNLGAAYCDRIRGEKADNLQAAICAFQAALSVFTREAFPQEWANTQNNLGNVYSNRIRGEKAKNIEIAISAFQAALLVYTREAFPREWAKIQNNLGGAYRERIRGKKADNLEASVSAYQAALEVRTCKTFPREWATTQNNLGGAYRERIRGKKAENIEVAISAYQAALSVYTHEAFPQDWAHTQNNLGGAYRERIRGKKAGNIEVAISAYQAALSVYTREAFPREWANIQNNLGAAYSNIIRGEKAENIEIAISAYQAALLVHTREAFPQGWAKIQNNLGTAYRDRIRGEKADNIEAAISAYQAALEVRTCEAFPQDWAGTQNNLGLAYCNRIRGEKADNIEAAISAFQAALLVYTYEAFPQDWAKIQNNLGLAYCNRIRGEKADNIEAAISAFQAALLVYTHEAFPQDWAQTQNNLGAAYCNRIRGEKAENIEAAIAACEVALEVRTHQAFPQEWAETQNNLGLAYYERIRGEKAENIEAAIRAYLAALEVSTCEAFPRNWAMTQNNLGFAYYERIRGEKAENIEAAISAYQAALEVRTREAFPQDWAATQNNLGNAYYERIRGEKAENIEAAIAAFEVALEVRTRKAFPQDWARTQNNLGNAYRDRIRGEKAENIEAAISAYQAALEVRTNEAFPQDYIDTSFNLGSIYRKAQKLPDSHNTFTNAINAVESLREEIVSGIEAKQKLAEKSSKFYCHIVLTCQDLGQLGEAFEYVERSKNRNLVEQILERDRNTIFPTEVVQQLEQIHDKIAIGQQQIQSGKVENYQELAEHLKQLRQQRNELQDKYLPLGSGFNFEQFQATLDEKTAIIELYLTGEEILTFVISKDSKLSVWRSTIEDQEALFDLANEYLRAYYNNKTEWQNNLTSRLNRLAEILHLEEVLRLIPENCSHLTLIPHRYLHLFPLHTLRGKRQTTKGEITGTLIELFPDGVSYAPSCQLLQQLQTRQRPNFQSLFAIQNPTEDLNFTDLEVASILPYFSSHQVLQKKQATKAAFKAARSQLTAAHCLHFSCHGSFNLSNPQDSALFLAGKETLTLGNLFERQYNFNQCRLVVLSACETGLIDFNNFSDEYIGLPSGFLYAGSSSVVSSLWTVNDLSTAFLMIKFYANLSELPEKQAGSIAIALNQAQLWLRDLTVPDLDLLVERFQPQLTQIFAQLPKGKQRIFQASLKQARQRKPHPFANPFYWAAFTANGI